MNCSRFRFLIQQSFDLSLTAQDERMLLAHLDTCDSCARFHHQLEQVIQGAPEVALPDEYTPSNIEALARQVMEELPRGGGGFMGFITNLLSSFSKPKAAKVDEIAQDLDESAGNYPHIRRATPRIAVPSETRPPKQNKARQDLDEDLRATSARLKNLIKLQQTGEQNKPTSRSSLSDKFGMSSPQMKDAVETPLTLAESIRRKVVEDKQGPRDESAPQETTNWSPAAEQAQQFPQDPSNFGGGWGSTEATPDWGFANNNAGENISTPAAPPTTSSVPAEPAVSNEVGSAKKPTWSDEAEQIQTGIWSAFQLDDSGLGIPAGGSKDIPSLSPENIPLEATGEPASPSVSERLTNILGNDLTSMAQAEITEEADVPSGGLFRNLDDKTIDKVFRENLGIGADAIARPSQTPPPLPGQQSQIATPETHPSSPISQPSMPPIPSMPSLNPAPTPPAPPTPTAPAAKSGGLFSLDDDAMDDIFTSHLGVNASVVQSTLIQNAPPVPNIPPITNAPQAPPVPPFPNMPGNSPIPPAPSVPPVPSMPGMSSPVPAPPVPAPGAKASQGSGNKSGLFEIDDDAMDQIFADNLGVKDANAPHVNVRQAVQTIRDATDTSNMPPKIEGIGKLDTKPEASSEVASGKIAAIGKFLLDQQDLTKIGTLTKEDLSDTKVRVLTLEAADEINKLLHHISTLPFVVGSVIVGHDGILIANNLPKELDPESIGIWSLAIYVGTTNAIKKIGGHNHLYQLVAASQSGYLVIADFGGGILVTVTNVNGTDKLIPLMRTITQLVAQ